MIGRLLFRAAKGEGMGKVVGAAFHYFGYLLPVKKVYFTKEVMAFFHPKPSYDNHLIISPRCHIKNLQQMNKNGYEKYFTRVWEAIMDIHARHSEFADSFVMVANGGKRQEVKQVHFHMFTGHEIVDNISACDNENASIYADDDLCIL